MHVCVRAWVCVCDHVSMCEWAAGYKSVDTAKKSSFSHIGLACVTSQVLRIYICVLVVNVQNWNNCKYPADIKGLWEERKTSTDMTDYNIPLLSTKRYSTCLKCRARVGHHTVPCSQNNAFCNFYFLLP